MSPFSSDLIRNFSAPAGLSAAITPERPSSQKFRTARVKREIYMGLSTRSKHTNALNNSPKQVSNKVGKKLLDSPLPGIIPLLDLTRKYRSIERNCAITGIIPSSPCAYRTAQPGVLRRRVFALLRCAPRYRRWLGHRRDFSIVARARDRTRRRSDPLPAHAPAPVIEPIVYVGAVPVLIDKAHETITGLT